MGFYTPGQGIRDLGYDTWLRLGILLQFRALALGAAVALSIVSVLAQLVTEGPVDLAARSFGGLFGGEVIALIATVPLGIRAMPWTTLLHVMLSGTWLFALMRYGAPNWSTMWAAVGLPGT